MRDDHDSDAAEGPPCGDETGDRGETRPEPEDALETPPRRSARLPPEPLADLPAVIARAREAWGRRRALGCEAPTPAGRCAAPLRDGEGYVCAACEARREQARRVEALRLGYGSIPPRFAWARWGAPELLGRCPRLAALPAERRERTLSGLREAASCGAWVCLRGPAGRGKSSLAAAMLRGVLDAGAAPDASREAWRRARGALWVGARALAKAKAEHPLGRGDPVLVIAGQPVSFAALTQAPLLVLDDVGSEATRNGAVEDLVHERHEAEAPTIVTTWLESDEEAGRLYGGGIVRRLFDPSGVIVGLSEEKRQGR